MKRTAFLVLILMLSLEACAVASSPIPTSSATASPTSTSTAMATATAPPSETPTPTPTALPPSETPSLTAPPPLPPPILPSRTRKPRRSTRTPTLTLTASPPSSTITPSPTLSCPTHTAYAVLSASAESLRVGDTVTITVTLINKGCVSLGLPQYRVYIEQAGTEAVLTPERPEPVVHGLSVPPGGSDSAEFELTAAAAGQASLTGSASFEVHLGYPGPAYWGYADTGEPVIITVVP